MCQNVKEHWTSLGNNVLLASFAYIWTWKIKLSEKHWCVDGSVIIAQDIRSEKNWPGFESKRFCKNWLVFIFNSMNRCHHVLVSVVVIKLFPNIVVVLQTDWRNSSNIWSCMRNKTRKTEYLLRKNISFHLIRRIEGIILKVTTTD